MEFTPRYKSLVEVIRQDGLNLDTLRYGITLFSLSIGASNAYSREEAYWCYRASRLLRNIEKSQLELKLD